MIAMKNQRKSVESVPSVVKIKPLSKMTKFTNPLDPENIAIKIAIRQWVTARFKLDESVEIGIVEHQCTEASCVHAETVISIENTEGSEFYKIAKPLVYIRKLDISLMQKMLTKTAVHRH